jgi:hypothetical protein
MDPTSFLTGLFPAILVISAPLTAVASFFLLWLFRRAVRREMHAQAGALGQPRPPAEPHRPPAGDGPDLAITTLEGTAAPPGGPTDRAITASVQRLAGVYGLAGLAYALIMALANLVAAGAGVRPTAFLWLTLSCAWPIVLALGLAVAASRAERLAIAGAYLAMLIVAWLLALVAGSKVSVVSLPTLWLLLNGEPTLLLLAFLTRRVRAVGPLVLALMIAGVAGACLIIMLLGTSDAAQWAVVSASFALGLDVRIAYFLSVLTGFLALVILGGWVLSRLGRAYQAKRFSDQALTLDAMWLVFALVQPMMLVFQHWAWYFTGLVAFGAYKLVLWAGMTWLMPRPPDGAASRMILLLRVFSLGKRSRHLFDTLSRRWLRVGSLCLITGPDLITSLVEPHEFLNFVGGRLARQFVQGEADLERRLSQLDTWPDPDGRYRVNEFFCYVDTWQMTMRRLAARSDAVLMDLRSFSPTKRGCLYELGQLLDGVPLERVLLLFDDSTDRAFLEGTLRDLWCQVPADSPNRAGRTPQVRLLRVAEGSPGEVRAMLGYLFGE